MTDVEALDFLLMAIFTEGQTSIGVGDAITGMYAFPSLALETQQNQLAPDLARVEHRGLTVFIPGRARSGALSHPSSLPSLRL